MIRSTLLILFLLFPSAFGVEAAEPLDLRTWTDSSGKYRVVAAFAGLRDGNVQLEKAEGGMVTLPLDRLSEADQQYVRQIMGDRMPRGSDPASPGRREKSNDSIAFDLPEDLRRATGKDSTSAESPGGRTSDASELIRTVVVSGVGIDPEKALQNAYSRAIEQAVGVLIDAETRIKNDEIIHDEVLTHSRGFVEEYDVLKRWEADGLHHAQIRAVVAAKKLVESLRTHNIAMREIQGQQMALQLTHEVASERDGAAMFAGIMDDYTIGKLFKVEILGKPEVVEKDQAFAKLLVPLRLTPDWENWQKLHERLESLLRQIAAKRSAFNTLPKREEMNEIRWIALDTEVAKALPSRLSDEGRAASGPGFLSGGARLGDPVIALLKSQSRSGGVTNWDVFRVPDSTGEIVEVLNRIFRREHQVRIALLDANEQPVVEQRMKLETGLLQHDACILGHYATCDGFLYHGVTAYWLAPLFWSANSVGYRYVYDPCEVTIRVEIDRLDEVATCAAFAEIYER